MKLKHKNNEPFFPAHVMARHRYQHAILDAMDRIDEGRRMMGTATSDLLELLKQDAQWRQTWNEFLAAGGITADEFCRWLVRQKQIRPVAKRRDHLRLVVNAV